MGNCISGPKAYMELTTQTVVDAAPLPGTNKVAATINERTVRIYEDGKRKEMNTRHHILANATSFNRMIGNH